MKFERSLVLAAVLAVVAPAAARSAEHPRLFFGPGDVAGLKARAQTTHKQIADGLSTGIAEFQDTTVAASGDVHWTSGRTFNVGDRRDIGNALVAFAFGAQLDDSGRTAALAKSWLMTVARFGSFDLDGEHDLIQAHLTSGVAIAYDMLYASLSDAERATIRAALVREADSLVAFARGGAWWAESYTQNHNWIDHAAVGFAALALEGEVDAAKTDGWLRFASDNAKKVASAVDGIVDGTWHEGWSYLAYGLQWHLPFLDALRRAGHDDLSDMALLRGFGAARAYAQIPDAPSTYVLASGDFTAFTNDEALLALRFAASRLKDGVAQAAADRWTAGTPRKVYAPEANQVVFEFLFYDPAVPASNLASAPLDWYGADQGAVVFRSGWEKGSTLFALKSGTFGGRSVWEKLKSGGDVGALNFGHDHADDNGFVLYANGAWAAPEAQGYFIGHKDSPGPPANGTAFHNALLVDGQEQLGSGVRDNSDDASRYGWFTSRQGSIPFRGSSRDFAFATGDGSKLYPSALGVTQWDRHALFVDRKVVVLVDQMKSAQPRTWTWLGNFTGTAAQEGRWIHGTGENGQSLGVAVVAPINYAMTFDVKAPVKADHFVKDGTYAGAQVKTGPTTDNTFVTALVPVAESGWGSRPTVDAIDAAQPHTGLRIVEGNRVSAVVYGGDARGVSVGGYALAGLAGVATTEGGAPARALLVQGGSIAKDGHELLRVDGGTDFLEADGLSSGEVTLSGKELKAARVWAPKATAVKWQGAAVPFRRDGEHLVVELAAAVPGEAPAGAAAPAEAGAPGNAATRTDSPAATGGGSGSSAGGGCAAGGPGDLAAIMAVLVALALVGRARRRRAAPAPVVALPVPPQRDEDEDEERRKASNE